MPVSSFIVNFADYSDSRAVDGYAATIDGLLGGPPLAHWRLGEIGGTQISDRKTGARHGTYSGTIGYGAAGLPQYSDGAIDFGGTGSGSVPPDTGLALSALSLSFWFKPAFIPADDDFAMPLVSKDASSANTDGDFVVYLPIGGGGSLRVRFRDGVGTVDLTSPVDVIQAGTAHHIVVRADSTGFDLYVDGVYYGKNTAYLKAWSVNTAAILFATNPHFSGVGDCVLDEVALYSRILTETEVLDLAQQTQLPVATGDTAGVPESATTAIDVLGNDSFVGTPTIEIISQPAGGDSVAVSGQVINYTAGAVTQDTARSFTYRITDPNGTSNTATVNVTVSNTASPPSALTLCYPSTGLRTVNVANAGALQAALNAAIPGDHIVLAAGNYGGDYILSAIGTAANPIVVRGASTANKPVFTDRIRLTGKFAVITGMDFNNGRVFLQPGADNNRITRNLFRNHNRSMIDIQRADFNRIDHNECRDKLTSTTNGQAGIKIRLSVDDGAAFARGNRIDHNYFHDMPNLPGVNGVSTIECSTGQGSPVESETVIDHNLFVNCLEEAESPIGTKSSGLTVEANTFVNGKRVSQRHGHGCIYKNNWIEANQNGMTIRGNNHKILGNHFVGGTNSNSLRLLRGDTSQADFEAYIIANSGAVPDQNQPYAEDCVIVGNTGDKQIWVGEEQFPDNDLPVTNTTIWDNELTITFPTGVAGHSGTTTNVDPGIGDPGVAVKLTPSDVGMTAPDPHCSG